MSSKVELFAHFVWATKHREPLVTSDIERDLHRCMTSVAEKLKCPVRAINGMSDHIHLIVSLHADVSASQLMKQVKGVSSALINDLHSHQQRFRWQEGYYARGMSLSHLKTVAAYVHNQKQHHAEGTSNAAWEDCGEEE